MPIYSATPRHCPGSRNTRSGCPCSGHDFLSNGSGNPFCTSGALEANAMTPPVNPYCPQQETRLDSFDQSARSGCSGRSNHSCGCQRTQQAGQTDCSESLNNSPSYQDAQSASSASSDAQQCACQHESSAQSARSEERSEENSGSSRRTRMGLSAFATGYAAGSIQLGEDQPVVFTAFSSQKARSVVQHDGTFTLAKPGTYQITALVNIPSGEDVDAVLHLTANGEIIPGSVTRVSSASHTGTYVLSAIVISDGTATVALTASQELSLTGAGSSDVLASITFLRLA